MKALVFVQWIRSPIVHQLLDIDKTIEASHSNSSPAGRDGNDTAEVSKLLFGWDLSHVPMGKPKNEANTLTTAPLRHIWLFLIFILNLQDKFASSVFLRYLQVEQWENICKAF